MIVILRAMIYDEEGRPPRRGLGVENPSLKLLTLPRAPQGVRVLRTFRVFRRTLRQTEKSDALTCSGYTYTGGENAEEPEVAGFPWKKTFPTKFSSTNEDSPIYAHIPHSFIIWPFFLISHLPVSTSTSKIPSSISFIHEKNFILWRSMKCDRRGYVNASLPLNEQILGLQSSNALQSMHECAQTHSQKKISNFHLPNSIASLILSTTFISHR